jgi:hypothetical protein
LKGNRGEAALARLFSLLVVSVVHTSCTSSTGAVLERIPSIRAVPV